MRDVLIEVQDLKKHFPVTSGLFKKVVGHVRAVDGVSFSIRQGETFGLVGESGCGKTTVSRLVMCLEKATSGRVSFRGKDVLKLRGGQLRDYRKSVQPVFQDPYSSLDPRLSVAYTISEPMVAMGGFSAEARKQRVTELLSLVGLNPASAGLYPHEFSGGQRQRIAIARALSTKPDMVILDEPVSALDVSVRAQLMNLLKDLQAELGLTYLVIAHDLAVVKYMSERIGVMYLGKLVESATSKELYSQPFHPYTQALLSAALPAHPNERTDEIRLAGEVPNPINPPSGCHFHPRCSKAMPVCSETEPVVKNMADGHWVCCHLYSTVQDESKATIPSASGPGNQTQGKEA